MKGMIVAGHEARIFEVGDLKIPVIYDNDEPYVVMAPVAKAMGLNWGTVYGTLKARFITHSHDVEMDHVYRPMLTMSAFQFIFWVAYMSTSEKHRERLTPELMSLVVRTLGELSGRIFAKEAPRVIMEPFGR